MVEAPGIETPAPSATCVASGGGKDAEETTPGDATEPRISASLAVSGASSTVDVDAAIRTAAKVAIDAGDFGRAKALLDLLSQRMATVTPFKAFRTLKP